ncbi:transmembrane protein, putative (macronuclear) [Tetrahymena thermophila SB210]|uniref:Transmembrane protein, putative n=1 Tax=Tetrahymena thermophila (strain SB210) TaxID=312017 RepID=Q22S52_TETTS|nr:transmembrane protein, putative [Tetrahymena thermophila SB210]EAR87920.2 transmembrane protein, putative [Tetrahymena thermophila SB210]|eukprot:XP_001008165.2 transmembrane protein, putative [Tetrahymena thermophila SB210]
MMKLKNLCKILYLQILVQISFQIDCVIQNSILNVPSTGCNLPSAQNQITQVDKLILNGQLNISRYAYLQYKTLEANDGAAMNLKSNYEQIKIEDIGTDTCSLELLKPVTMSLSSQSQNFVYDIYSISNSNQLTIRDLPLGLFHGVKILISSLSGLTEYAIVDKILDQVVYLQNPLQKNHLSWQVAGKSLQTYYPKLIVIDEQRIIFKNACLKIFPQKPQDLLNNAGILFQDMKGLSYENQDLSNIVGLTQSIFLNSDNFTNQFFQIQGQISNILIIGVNELTINDQTQLSSIQYISMYRMNKSSLNIFAIPDNLNPIILDSWYLNDCQVTLYLDNPIDTQQLLNSNLLNIQLKIVKSYNGPLLIQSNNLLNCILSKDKNRGYPSDLTIQANQIAGKELNMQNFDFLNAYILQNYFDGTRLMYAILLSQQVKQEVKQANIVIDRNIFSNFEYQGYDLITTTLQSTGYQEPVLQYSEYIYQVTLKTNIFNILPSSQQKVIFLPSLILNYQYYQNYDRYFLALPLDDTIYHKTKTLRKYPLTSIIYHKPLFFFWNFLGQISFDIGNATGYYMDIKTQEFNQTWQIGTTYYILEDTIYKAYFKSTLDNQLSAAPEQLNLYTFNWKEDAIIPQIKIYFKSSTPIQAINVQLNGNLVASDDEYVSIDPIDGCLNVYPKIYDSFRKPINITITKCQDGQVLSNQQCVSNCPDGQHLLNSVCLDGKQKEGYYFQNNQYLPCLGGANNNCKACSTSNDCQECFILEVLSGQLCYVEQYQQFYSISGFQNCFQNCQYCYDQQICSVCVEGYVLSQDQNSCNLCPQGNFIKDKECISCPSNFNCADCFSDQAGSCRSCKPGFTLVKGFCQQTCIQSQYLDNFGICQPCDPTCLECSDSGKTNCTRCSKGKILNVQPQSQTCEQSTCTNLQFLNNNNVCQNCFDQTNQNGCFDSYPNSIICDSGHYAQQNVSGCQMCDKSCKTCQYQSTNCIECNQDYSFISGNSGQCQKCQDGFYAPLNAITCLSCSSPCKTCSGSSNNCLTCLDGFYFDSNSSNGKCIKCDVNCMECMNTSTQCTKCPQNSYLSSNKCLNCPAGQYVDPKSQQCANCDFSCSKCSESSTNCTECYSGQFLSNGQCIKCDVNCKECMNISTQCTKCPQNQYLSSNKCLSDCPTGQYADSQLRICEDCDKSKSKECLKMQNIKLRDTKNGLEQGALVGIALGSFAFLTAVIITLRYFYKKRKQNLVIQIDPNFKNNLVYSNTQINTQRDIETKNQEEAKEQTDFKVIN